MQRRDFLEMSLAAGSAAATGQLLSSLATAAETAGPTASPPMRQGDMIYRPLGRTGENVSVIGLGGFHLGSIADPAETTRVIRRAIDQGVTFMDNCWDYHDGQSEVRMGNALKDGYRQRVFLMSKIDGRTKEAAARQIDESLRRLQTDHVDLMQFHEVIRLEDPDRIFADNGAVHAMLEARKAGKVRFIGFTGHKDPLVHLRMLEIGRNHDFRFDAVQMPLNVMDFHFRSFAHMVLPVLVMDQIGVLGMKPMSSGIILKSQTVKPIECLHFAMNLPVSTVITGVDSEAILDQAMEAVRTFRPLSYAELTSLVDRTGKAAAEGKFEPFKTSQVFDGTALHPQWLG